MNVHRLFPIECVCAFAPGEEGDKLRWVIISIIGCVCKSAVCPQQLGNIYSVLALSLHRKELDELAQQYNDRIVKVWYVLCILPYVIQAI